jgi:hypothetical protein
MVGASLLTQGKGRRQRVPRITPTATHDGFSRSPKSGCAPRPFRSPWTGGPTPTPQPLRTALSAAQDHSIRRTQPRFFREATPATRRQCRISLLSGKTGVFVSVLLQLPEEGFYG